MPGRNIKIGIRAWLLSLVVVASLPIVVFSIWTLTQLGRAQESAIIESVLTRATDSAATLGLRLDLAAGTLAAVARSDAALAGDLAALHAHARRLLDLQPDVTAITLIGPEGEQVFNTLQPFGKILPPSNDIPAARRVFETAKPVASGPYIGSFTPIWFAAIGVPVMRGDKVAYVLRAVIRAENFLPLLSRSELSDEWSATLANPQGTIIARTRAHETNVGTLLPPLLADRLARRDYGTGSGITKEGVAVSTALVPVPNWPWVVAVAVPKEALHGPLRRSLLSVSAAAAVLLALTAAAAWWLANTLSRQITGAVAAVAALGNGTEPPTAEGSIRELAAIGHSVAHVKQREMRAGLALADAIVETEQVKAELASARHDQLTGLPSRALFLELTEAATRHSSRSDSRMAVLFVDLDGFKRVNDEKGHQRGDEVLAETAAILRNVVRGSDSCGRLGGDEFAICLTADTATIDSADTATINDIAVAVAGRIVEQVAGIGDGIGCSIGIAICPPGPVDLAAALRQADAAMYDAKRQGKNRFSIYR